MKIEWFDDYQFNALRTARSTLSDDVRQCNWAMGLAGEAGETCDYIKKVVCHGHELDRDHVVKELGDVLWYVAVMANEYGITLAEIATENIEKLNKRYPEGFDAQKSINRAD